MDEKVFRKELGKRLKRERKEKNWTLEQLAEKINMNDKHLGAIERGEKVPKVDTFFKIRQVLHLKADPFFDQIEEKIKWTKLEDN